MVLLLNTTLEVEESPGMVCSQYIVTILVTLYSIATILVLVILFSHNCPHYAA